MQVSGLIQSAFHTGRKLLAVLVDPDRADAASLIPWFDGNYRVRPDLVFYGGSLLCEKDFEPGLKEIKKSLDVPLVIFPGNAQQVSPLADAILFHSLISGRNADLLIGRQVEAAPAVRAAGLEVLPTGYLLVDGGKMTTAHYVSQNLPIPYDKPEIAAVTALAGKFLGLQYIYLDGGSGAVRPVSAEMVKAVRETVHLPLMVGGGIRTPEQALELATAGADIIVVGSLAEAEPEKLEALSRALHEFPAWMAKN